MVVASSAAWSWGQNRRRRRASGSLCTCWPWLSCNVVTVDMHGGVRPREFIWIKFWGLTPLHKLKSSGLSPVEPFYSDKKAGLFSQPHDVRTVIHIGPTGIHSW